MSVFSISAFQHFSISAFQHFSISDFQIFRFSVFDFIRVHPWSKSPLRLWAIWINNGA